MISFEEGLVETMREQKTDRPENKVGMGYNQSLEDLKAELFRIELKKK